MKIKYAPPERFRYTFKKKPFGYMKLESGNYELNFSKYRLIISVDKFGMTRLANETPFNNCKKLFQLIRNIEEI